jgi:NADH dehydrogenase
MVTVFGGNGFLGRRIVRQLADQGLSVRVASRHPDRALSASAGTVDRVFADINDEASVTSALATAYGVVNAVSLYVESGPETFHSLHVEAAERLARQARRGGVERLVQVSGIGADAASDSLYIRKRGEGELAVRAAFADAIVMRPAVMFGRDDAFLTVLLKLLRHLPVYPLFGQGKTRLQPVHVEDVAAAIAHCLQPDGAKAITYELGGPRIYTYEELVRMVAGRLGRRPVLVPLPYPFWDLLARIAETLPGAPLSRNQVQLMQLDTVTTPGMAGFDTLGIVPQSLEHALEDMLEER